MAPPPARQVNNNGGSPCHLQPPQQAAAFGVWADMVAAALPGTLLVGPDTGGADPLAWLQAFLPLVPPGMLHGITHHVYNGIQRSNFNSVSACIVRRSTRRSGVGGASPCPVRSSRAAWAAELSAA